MISPKPLKMIAKGMLIGFLTASVWVPFTVRSSSAEDTPDRRKREHLESEARQIEQKIDRSEKRLKEFSAKEATVISDLNDLDRTIDRLRRRIAANRKKMAEIEGKIESATQTHRQLVRDIETNESYVADRVVALYRLRWFDRMQFLASADSVFDMLQRKRQLEIILDHDQRIRQKLFEDKQRLKSVLDDLHSKQSQKQQLQAAVTRELKRLSAEQRRRSQLLSRIRDQRSIEKEVLESLRQAAAELDQTINTLSDRPAEPVVDAAVTSFSELKGLLRRPVSGKIVTNFGHYTDTKFNLTHFRSGIDIQASKGAKIQAVYAGRIIYADWFKGYGNMIIIDHGDSYYTVYAHLRDMYKQTGDRVNTGEDIASVGESGSIVGPVLHFEVRHHGKPVDPKNWLTKG